MAIAPNPRYLRFACRRCGWSQVVPQLGDVLIAELPGRCLKCDSQDIDVRPISAWEYAARKLLR